MFDVCGLEIDPATGAVRVDRYVTAHDAGRLLNPALADGQIRGAFAQGLGAALLEEAPLFDPKADDFAKALAMFNKPFLRPAPGSSATFA